MTRKEMIILVESKLNEPEADQEWREVIEYVKELHKGTTKGKYIELKYEKKKGMIPICMELFISQSCFYAWREDIINEVIVQAAYKQLIKP